MSNDELELASIIRRAAQIRPFGPNSVAVHAAGGSVMLTPAEAEAASRAVLASSWLAARDEAVRVSERVRLAGEVSAAKGCGWCGYGAGHTTDEHVERWGAPGVRLTEEA